MSILGRPVSPLGRENHEIQCVYRFDLKPLVSIDRQRLTL